MQCAGQSLSFDDSLRAPGRKPPRAKQNLLCLIQPIENAIQLRPDRAPRFALRGRQRGQYVVAHERTYVAVIAPTGETDGRFARVRMTRRNHRPAVQVRAKPGSRLNKPSLAFVTCQRISAFPMSETGADRGT